MTGPSRVTVDRVQNSMTLHYDTVPGYVSRAARLAIALQRRRHNARVLRSSTWIVSAPDGMPIRLAELRFRMVLPLDSKQPWTGGRTLREWLAERAAERRAAQPRAFVTWAEQALGIR